MTDNEILELLRETIKDVRSTILEIDYTAETEDAYLGLHTDINELARLLFTKFYVYAPGGDE
jgi:hypothetical protein